MNWIRMVLDYGSLIRANVSDSEHNHTRYGTVSYDSQYALVAYAGCWVLMSRVVLDVFFLVVCINLGPKTAISRGEQNRYGWRRRILLTARLTKFYGGLRLMKSTAAYGGLRRRLGALVCLRSYENCMQNFIIKFLRRKVTVYGLRCNFQILREW